MKNESIPEVTLSKEGYQGLRKKVMEFQTDLQLATANTLGFILRRFQEYMKPYYWLSAYDVIGMMTKIDQMFTCDITRKDLLSECDALIAAISTEISKDE